MQLYIARFAFSNTVSLLNRFQIESISHWIFIFFLLRGCITLNDLLTVNDYRLNMESQLEIITFDDMYIL